MEKEKLTKKIQNKKDKLLGLLLTGTATIGISNVSMAVEEISGGGDIQNSKIAQGFQRMVMIGAVEPAIEGDGDRIGNAKPDPIPIFEVHFHVPLIDVVLAKALTEILCRDTGKEFGLKRSRSAIWV